MKNNLREHQNSQNWFSVLADIGKDSFTDAQTAITHKPKICKKNLREVSVKSALEWTSTYFM